MNTCENTGFLKLIGNLNIDLRFFMVFRFKRAVWVALISIAGLESVFAEDTLIFAIDVIRHGDRTPTIIFPNAPHEWPEGQGQLTATGMRQEYELGLDRRREYVDQRHFLPSVYQSATMKASSTNFDRTLMSAQSFLYGFYPLGTGPALPSGDPALPGKFQPIPIYAMPIETQWPTEEYNALIKNHTELTPEWKAKTALLSPNFPRWSQVLGVPIQSISALNEIGDALTIRQRYGIPLPEGLSSDDAKAIREAGQFVMVTPLRDPVIYRLTGQPLFNLIAKEFAEKVTQKNPLKYELFAAHDTTLLSVMSVMGVPITEQPPFASDLNFELFDSGKGKYIQVKLNHELLKIPQCGGTTCTIDQFEGLVRYTPRQ
jgi:acid phosphatase